ncbi:phage tail tape measure protein, partial [Rhodobaculum claviforme]
MDDMDTRVSALEASLDGARGATQAFDAELAQMGRTMGLTGREVDGLGRQVGNGLRRAFDGMAMDGMKLSDALRSVSRSMVDAVYSASVRPVQGAVGGAVSQGVQSMMQSFLPFASGGQFAQGRVMPFAEGGIVSGPVAFPMRGGQTGLMGEAGPE